MARISLQEQYDNKDVIHQIYGLKETVSDAIVRIDTAVTTANEASATATSMGTRLTAVEESQATASAKADAAVKAEVKGVALNPEGTDGFSVTLNKAEGSLNSGKFNLGKVKRASIHKGTALNSIYFQLELTDGTTVRSADAVIDISGVETDIHVTGLTLYEEPESHGIYAVFAMNDGSTVRSNTIAYDYPDTATANAKGLVKGSTADGGVAVNSDGTMTVNGYTDLKTRVSDTESKANTNQSAIGVINETTIPGLRSEMTTADTSLRQGIQANTDAIASHATVLDDLNTRTGTLEGDVGRINTTIGSESLEGSIKSNINTLWSNVRAHGTTITEHGERLNTVEPKVTANTNKLENMVTTISGVASDFYVSGSDEDGYLYRFNGWPYEYVDGARFYLEIDERRDCEIRNIHRLSGSRVMDITLSQKVTPHYKMALHISSAYPDEGHIIWSDRAFREFVRLTNVALDPRVTALEGNVATIEQTQSNHETRIHANETSISTLNTSVNANTTSVTGLTESVNTLNNSVNALSASVPGKQDKLTAGTGITISEENVISLSQTGADSLNIRITPTTATTGPISEIEANGNITTRYGYYIKFKFAKGTLRRDTVVPANNSVVDVIGDYTVDMQKIAPYCAINFTNPAEYDEVDVFMEKAWLQDSHPTANDLIKHFTFIRVVY